MDLLEQQLSVAKDVEEQKQILQQQAALGRSSARTYQEVCCYETPDLFITGAVWVQVLQLP